LIIEFEDTCKKENGNGVIIPSRIKLVAALFSFSINEIIAAYIKNINIAMDEKISIISSML